MEFFQGRGSSYEEEEEEIIGNMGKLPFSFSSSSSSHPSSSQYKGVVVSQPDHRWGSQIFDKHQGLSLSDFNHKPELMDLSPRYNDNNGQGESDGGGRVGGSDIVCIEKEHMFDKVVTPSDVGKLNRLVIPKQHAEKYFPLDSSASDKGLLLCFEDRSGKPWRFRYSYWNSSQSYVMTKGWSRFVKDKKLYAGDIVSFERGAGELGKDRLYIDWKRRSNPSDQYPSLPPLPFPLARSVPWGQLVMPPTRPMSMPLDHHMHLQQQLNYEHYHHHHHHQYHHNSYAGSTNGYNVVDPNSDSIYYLRSSAPQDLGGDVSMVFDPVPVVHGKAAAKRLRLFGVNMEFPTSEDPEGSATQDTTLISQFPQLPPTNLPLQLRLYNGAPIPTIPIELPKEGKQSLSLDFDI